MFRVATAGACSVLVLVLGGYAPVSTAGLQAAAQSVAQGCARVWMGKEADFEAYLKTAAVTSMQAVPVGVTRPSRAFLAPGGLAESIAWKEIPPGFRNGFWESYKSEIAAYELDKLLELRMVPPTVEKQVDGKAGAAVLWASPTRSFKDMGGVPGQGRVAMPAGATPATWNRQVVHAKMFDNLIANKDPNLGNWLVDEDGHLILIDHSRSFTTMRSMVHKMESYDRDLWDRIAALDEATLDRVLGPWLRKDEIRGILERRNRMKQDVERLARGR